MISVPACPSDRHCLSPHSNGIAGIALFWIFSCLSLASRRAREFQQKCQLVSRSTKSNMQCNRDLWSSFCLERDVRLVCSDRLIIMRQAGARKKLLTLPVRAAGACIKRSGDWEGSHVVGVFRAGRVLLSPSWWDNNRRWKVLGTRAGSCSVQRGCGSTIDGL